MANVVRKLCRNLTRVWRVDSSVAYMRSLYSTDSRYVPRRACLYVPGNDERKLRKIASVQADCVILDCEDGVALNRKAEARSTICHMLDELNFGLTEPIVRVNSVDSGLAGEDLDVILTASNLPPTIMVPKVESVHHMNWINEQLTGRLKSRKLSSRMNVIVFVESAMAVLNLRDICQYGQQMSEDTSSVISLAGVVFGSDDYIADIGATRTKDAKELLYARQHVVMVAKAYQLQAIDIVYIDFKDSEGLFTQSVEGAEMGFTGKQCIHPDQVSVIQRAFTPGPDKVKWASELIQAFNAHQESGKGAFTFHGAMIDKPLLLQAKNILHITQSDRK